MSGDRRPGAIEIVASPGAPAGSADPSRRWALAPPDGAPRFPGLTRPEGDAAIAALGVLDPGAWGVHLVQVTLAVVLSDGAGPYLLDVDGRITLVLGAHPTIPAAHLAMGEAAPDHRLGLVRRVGDGPAWEWLADARVPPPERIAALDALDACAAVEDARRWAGGAPG